MHFRLLSTKLPILTGKKKVDSLFNERKKKAKISTINPVVIKIIPSYLFVIVLFWFLDGRRFFSIFFLFLIVKSNVIVCFESKRNLYGSVKVVSF